jgi:catechol 2,3-dioxygenase-like lactoylglutathione lyase family enzyme
MTDRVGFLTAVVVRDQDRALDFYVNKLGFEKVRDKEIERGTRQLGGKLLDLREHDREVLWALL